MANTDVRLPSIDPVRLYTFKEAGELMNCSPYEIRMYVKSGQLRVKRTRRMGRPKIPGAQIIAFLTEDG